MEQCQQKYNKHFESGDIKDLILGNPQGSFRVDPGVTGLPLEKYWIVRTFTGLDGYLIAQITDTGNSMHYEISYNQGSNPQWSWWQKIATATPPQEFDFPLRSGFFASERSVYCKAQESWVFFNYFGGKSSGNDISNQVIADLPVGYKPSARKFICAQGLLLDGSYVDGRIIITSDGDKNTGCQIQADFNPPVYRVLVSGGFLSML